MVRVTQFNFFCLKSQEIYFYTILPYMHMKLFILTISFKPGIHRQP